MNRTYIDTEGNVIYISNEGKRLVPLAEEEEEKTLCGQCGEDAPVQTSGRNEGEPRSTCVSCGKAICHRHTNDLWRSYSCLHFDAQEKDGEGGAFGDDYHVDCWEGVRDSADYWNTVKFEYARSRGV